VSDQGATAFCVWLSRKTGRRYRLPTEAEWRFACGRGRISAAEVGRYAWYRGNADFKTHAVGTREADAAGLHDMYGNASEWCTGTDGLPVTLGGSYRDPIQRLGCAARVTPSAAWNQSDPQIPRSVWWLADAGFVGFRVVCVPDGKAGE
jgi:formylglycine-generating enzyme required for sulfatase activity